MKISHIVAIKMQKRRIKCDYEGCNRNYCSYFNLKRHIESSHMGVRKFRCATCQKFLSSKQNYIDHQNIHTGLKPYVCKQIGCDQKFRQLSQYYLHMQLHAESEQRTPSTTSKNQDFLSILTGKIGREPRVIYNIPLIPYSLAEAELPMIDQPQQFRLPACPIQGTKLDSNLH